MKLFKWQSPLQKHVRNSTLGVHTYPNGTKLLVLEVEFYANVGGEHGRAVWHAGVNYEDEDQYEEPVEEGEDGE